MDDTQEKVKITWRYRNPTKKAIVLVPPSGDLNIAVLGKRPYIEFWDEVYFTAGKIDTDKSYHHGVIRTEKRPIQFDATDIARLGIKIPAEGQYEVWAKFVRPVNKDTDKIHLHLPEVELLENLKIATEKK